MKIKYLYGVVDTETGYLLTKYRSNRYAWIVVGWVKRAFAKELENPRYKLVRLDPIIL